eukprot:scaffold196448_cov18-Tisochrysis_lutea.AAC.1
MPAQHPGMPWTAAEELILVRAHQENGNRWSEISKLLPDRTETNVKNHVSARLGRAVGMGGMDHLDC